MSDIEWSPAVQHDGSAVCPEEARGVRTQVKQNHDWDWVDADSNGEFWPWHKVVCYRIPMADYRRIYGDPLDSHPNSEADADRYSVGADTVDDCEDQPPRSKYHREIVPGVWVDVYDVLKAWSVTNPALQHLIKKALAPGERGHKTLEQDMADIVASAKRAQELS